jgi:4-diphosphocytidyl-2-C-methyl-D-erythritol kinase
MLIRRSSDAVVALAPAKVNLFLEVTGRRPDGYHGLATLMITVGLFDTVELRETSSPDVSLTCDDPALSVGEDNLVMKAARLVRSRFGITHGVALTLRKRIPMQAGLAGGSSDAAATLAGLNSLWRLGLSSAQLVAMGAELGSDVPFFFHAPSAWCTGRGEVVEPLKLGSPLHLVIACPNVGLSTAAVFKRLRLPEESTPGEPMRRAAISGNIEEIGRLLFNRLEGPAEEMAPEVGRLRESMLSASPLGARMSGSGSAVFALCRDTSDAWRVARAVAEGREARGPVRVIVVRSCDF